MPNGIGIPRPTGRGAPTSVIKSVPKSRFYDSFSLKGEALGGKPAYSRFTVTVSMRNKGFSLGRSCQPLALRNQWLTDVGSAAGGIGFCFSIIRGWARRPTPTVFCRAKRACPCGQALCFGTRYRYRAVSARLTITSRPGANQPSALPTQAFSRARVRVVMSQTSAGP